MFQATSRVHKKVGSILCFAFPLLLFPLLHSAASSPEPAPPVLVVPDSGLAASLASGPLGTSDAETVPETRLDAYVPGGLPLVFSNLGISRPGGLTSYLSFRVTASGTEAIRSLDLLLLEFDSGRRLVRVDGWLKELELEVGKPAELTLPMERRLHAGHRLVLLTDRAGGLRRRWEADLPAVARGAAGSAAQTSAVSIYQEEPLSPDTGALLCLSGYQRAMQLALAGDGNGISSYTCNQQERSFQFTFNGKVLGD